MNPNTTGAGAILLFCAVIGLTVAYWFHVASYFVHNNSINLSQTSFFPVFCTIEPDRAADTKVSAQVYFLQGSVRLDVQSQSLGQALIYGHEIIKSDGTVYAWRDDNAYGNISKDAKDYPILNGISATNSWFCFPWIFLDSSKLEPPGSITFQ